MTEIPELEIVVIKMINGDDVIATMDKNMSYGDKNFILINPIRIDREKYYDEDDIIEFATYKTWLPGTEQKLISVPVLHIITYAIASESAINSYNEYHEGRKAQALAQRLEHLEPNIPILSSITIH